MAQRNSGAENGPASEPVILDVAGVTDEEVIAAAEKLDDSFREQRRLYLLRPATEVGPDGLTDEQITEMAEAMADALWREHEDRSGSLSDDR